MKSERELEKPMTEELIPALKDIREMNELWLYRQPSKFERKASVQIIEESPIIRLLNEKPKMLESEEEEPTVTFGWPRVKAAPEVRRLEERITQLSRQTESLRQELGTQRKHLEGLIDQVTRQGMREKFLRGQVQQITDNKLAHINERLETLFVHIRAPLSTFYVSAAFVIFVAIVGVISLPASIGWPIAGICGAILCPITVGINRLAKTKRE